MNLGDFGYDTKNLSLEKYGLVCDSGSSTARNREKFGSLMGREDLIRSRNKPGVAGDCPDLGGNSCSQG